MRTSRDIEADLGQGAPEQLIRLAERLDSERPVPAPAFRGALRRRLLAGPTTHARPARLRLLISAYATTGCSLLVLGAASVIGLGPLGA